MRYNLLFHKRHLLVKLSACNSVRSAKRKPTVYANIKQMTAGTEYKVLWHQICVS